jgi:hypothetical protein
MLFPLPQVPFVTGRFKQLIVNLCRDASASI